MNPTLLFIEKVEEIKNENDLNNMKKLLLLHGIFKEHKIVLFYKVGIV